MSESRQHIESTCSTASPSSPQTKKESVRSDSGSAPRKAVEELGLQLDFAKVSQSSNEEHVLFSPMHYEPGYAYPLLIWLHGPAQDERQIMKLMPLISMRNYVAIAPRGVRVRSESQQENEQKSSDDSSDLKRRKKILLRNAGVPDLMLKLKEEHEKRKESYDWPQTEDGISEAERQIFDCISLAQEKCNVSSSNVYLAGFDTGGTMAFRIAMQFPQYFAGVASFGGRFPLGYVPLGQWPTVRNLPALLTIGQKSRTYSPKAAAEDLKLFYTAGLSVSARQYDCGQEISLEMLQDLNRWIMERVCNAK